jgi:hypothetical protein
MLTLGDSLVTNLQMVRRNWHRPWAAIPIAIATTAVTLWCCDYFRTSPLSVVDGIIAAAAVALVLIGWFVSNRLPRVERGNLGFGISLVYDNDDQAKRIQDDFITKMQSLVGNWPADRAVKFLALPGHIAEELETTPPKQLEKTSARFANATGCHFMIWGRAKRRCDDEEIHILELHGLAACPESCCVA